jgi:hypothetical protein
MANTLLGLVGEQPAPNLIPLFADSGKSAYDRVQYIVTDKKEIQDVGDQLISAIGQDPSLTGIQVESPASIDAWNLANSRKDCIREIEKFIKQGDAVTINLTGGTKIMSLAAFQAAVECGVSSIYVNTERNQILHFDHTGRHQDPTPYSVYIPIETQFRVAGREISQSLQPEDLPGGQVELAHYILDNYVIAHENLIRKILQQVRCVQKPLEPLQFTPKGKSVEAASRIASYGFWEWNRQTNTFTIRDQCAYDFLKGGWVETFVISALAKDRRFDQVLGNVKIPAKNHVLELDVVVSRNGRLGIVECKTTGPARAESKSSALAKIGIHEAIFGGVYAKAVLARPSNEDYRDWEVFCELYKLPKPIYGNGLKDIAEAVGELLGANG